MVTLRRMVLSVYVLSVDGTEEGEGLTLSQLKRLTRILVTSAYVTDQSLDTVTWLS